MARYLLISILLHITVLTIFLTLYPILNEKTHVPRTSSKPISVSIVRTSEEVTSARTPKILQHSKEQCETTTCIANSAPLSENKDISKNPSECQKTLEGDQRQEPSENEKAKVRGVISPPRPIYTPPVEYPLQARLRKIQGSVTLGVVISTNGRVKEPRILKSSNHRILDCRALEYIEKVIFEPARNEVGEPIETEVNYVLHFVLTNQ